MDKLSSFEKQIKGVECQHVIIKRDNSLNLWEVMFSKSGGSFYGSGSSMAKAFSCAKKVSFDA